MSADRQQARAYALLALVMLLWAGNSIVGRAVREDVGPFVLSFVRWAGRAWSCFPSLSARCGATGGVLRRRWAHRGRARPYRRRGVQCLMYTGLHHTTATNGLLAAGGDSAGGARRDRMCSVRGRALPAARDRRFDARRGGHRCSRDSRAMCWASASASGTRSWLIAVVDWASLHRASAQAPHSLAAELPAGDVPRRA
jgi:hypothetical protein